MAYNATKSLLDHFYVNKKANYPCYGNCTFGGSDHNLTFISRKINRIKYPAKTIVYRKYKDCNWEDLEKFIK